MALSVDVQIVEQVALPIVEVDRLATRLSEAVQYQTIPRRKFPDGRPEDFQLFIDWLQASFPSAAKTMEREMINRLTPLYRWKGSGAERPILLTAHYDVVSVEDASGSRWDHPPFGGAIADGFVWARGTMDDKGALVAMMGAVEVLIAEGASAVADHLAAQGIQLAWSLDKGSAVLRAIVPGLNRDVASINVAEKGGDHVTG